MIRAAKRFFRWLESPPVTVIIVNGKSRAATPEEAALLISAFDDIDDAFDAMSAVMDKAFRAVK